MNQFTIYCTAEQTKRAYKLGAPIEDYTQDDVYGKSVMKEMNKVLSLGTLEKANEILAKSHQVLTEDGAYLECPTTQQMIGWLREKFRIRPFVSIYLMLSSFYIINKMEIVVVKDNDDMPITYDSYEQSELAAIDAALDYLEHNKD